VLVLANTACGYQVGHKKTGPFLKVCNSCMWGCRKVVYTCSRSSLNQSINQSIFICHNKQVQRDSS